MFVPHCVPQEKGPGQASRAVGNGFYGRPVRAGCGRQDPIIPWNLLRRNGYDHRVDTERTRRLMAYCLRSDSEKKVWL